MRRTPGRGEVNGYALEAAQERCVELEKLKDKEDVKALYKKTPRLEALQGEFDVLIESVNETKPQTFSVVIKYIIMDYFAVSGSINWYNDKYEFEEAIKYGLISQEDHSVRWDRAKLKPFKKALEEVKLFLESNEGEQLRKLQEPGVPMDPDDLEFWEYQLNI